MKALEAFNAGSLEEAIELAKEQVKKNPTDVNHRHVFAEMLCWSGDLERADKQLETLSMQDPQAAMPLALFRQLIRGEMTRQECFRKGNSPEVLKEMDPVTEMQMELLLCLREENNDRASELAEKIEAERPKIKGVCDGNEFEDMRDLDDSCASFFEVLTSTGKYFWVPMQYVETIAFAPVENSRDLMWRRAHMVVAGGPDGEVFLPTNYALSLGSDDKQLRLGRATDWKGVEDGPLQGLGRRLLLIGEEDKSLLDVTEIEFAEPKSTNSAE